jgi:neutral ceramidase
VGRSIAVAVIRVVVALLALNSAFAEDSPPLHVGAASKVINNRLGGWVQGAGVPRTATKQRDDLEANGLYLSDGKTKLLLVSCDLVGLNSAHVAAMREAMGEVTGISSRNILITCTHTHGGPSLVKTNYLMPIDHAYLARLQSWLVELAQVAVQSARPGKIGWGKGKAQIGFNRRLCWSDGTHTMHGDASRVDFAGLEGPDDPQHLAIFAADANGKLIAVLHHNTTHPTIFYAAGIYSADFPGVAREILRKELGDIPVLYLNGAQGDIAIDDMLHRRSESREEKLQRIARMTAAETLRLHENVTYHDHPTLDHAYDDLKVNVRLPDPTRLVEARKVLARIDAGEDIRGMSMIMAFGAVHLHDMYGENPVDTLPVHTIRIGDVALVTQPCKLYCQFGLDIKRRSPAPITAVVGLADGYGGYCPTIYGILGGGYSGQPIYWTRLESNAGYQIVESAGRLLNTLWRSNRSKEVQR